MAITAKFPGTCVVCGVRYAAGSQIDGRKGAWQHATCPAVGTAQAATAITLSGGSGYGCKGWEVGQVIRNPGRAYGSTVDVNTAIRERVAAWRAANPAPTYTLWAGAPDNSYVAGETADQRATKAAAEEAWKLKTDFAARAAEWQRTRQADDDAMAAARKAASSEVPAHNGPEYLLILTARSRYIREDGLSFGVGDDSGTLYTATARAATDVESAPLRERLGLADVRRDAAIEIKEICAMISTTGDRPEAVRPGGTVVWERSGGSGGYFERLWIDESAGRIWYDRYNGADGDDWSHNNCGGFAIVTGVPWSEALSAKITTRAGALRS